MSARADAAAPARACTAGVLASSSRHGIVRSACSSAQSGPGSDFCLIRYGPGARVGSRGNMVPARPVAGCGAFMGVVRTAQHLATVLRTQCVSLSCVPVVSSRLVTSGCSQSLIFVCKLERCCVFMHPNSTTCFTESFARVAVE